MTKEAEAGIDVTIIFLEMVKPPAQAAHPPANRQVALLKSKAVPLHFYRYLMDRVGRQWHWVSRLRLADAELTNLVHSPNCEIGVLYLDGAPAGFFELCRDLPERVDLAYFGLMEQAIGQGLGRWFLSVAVNAAWSHQPRRVTVQTCTLDHPAALPLYQKIGFSPVGTEAATIYPLSLAERGQILARG